ncbi:CYTH and CHAD domain-containing protein [Streptomyces sp. WAC05374]|uniref:CYTH and CHAD domain-containing protein n=1 Tax=Streptomyces sp. WAC05374 TaxID=2487420 RepID=UPI000F86DCE4|nr:CYTH and CHAD domain-containing protein [Streptomyces sp. WAC05374]RST16719.1 CYTH and CHAD domain-containing protein [Streptomyces sp. WAC05374]TDF45367.1 CYTH and CHAD domain-containing protein [Streptomyces sp. WAC05374]TDF55645.1 CYTH and CHAD domain-containing protein [Streptomyces sp. WAC05374]TDF59171.1 CYTH and CHAD domain-containing protein [Streptomyces sp. WAC05374]
MADAKREIERKYEAAPDTRLPDLTGVRNVSAVVDGGVAELDAVYYDTEDLRLAAASLTLRRRTGGDDAGWHLKLPVAPGVRDELHAPLEDDVPDALARLVRARTRGAALVPLVRLRSHRRVRRLVDAEGAPLAEAVTDTVRAERIAGGHGGTVEWTEIEVELADGGDPALLDAVHKRLRKKGLKPAGSASKLARALTDTGWRPPEPPEEDGTAGGRVLAHLREQAGRLATYDAAVRRDLPDAVHQMRVATRRLRSAFRSYRKVLDRRVTDPLAQELKWLAGELGVDRDQEVLTERLTARVDALPVTLLLGPVRARLRAWAGAGRAEARARTLAALDSDRYTALLDALDALLADPPLRPAAAKAAGDVLPRAILKEHARLAARVERALALPAGHDRDVALHEARKTAKRVRYAAEVAQPALGRPAKRFAKRVKAVQKALGEHQDSVVARDTLRELAIKAHAAGETAFTWGLLHGREEALADRCERELPGLWERAVPGKPGRL